MNFKDTPEGPPPTDSGFFNEYYYYYDVYINETTQYLLDLDPKISIVQAIYMHGDIKITERELTNFFQKITFVPYGIRINNTNLENLSFLRPQSVGLLDNTDTSIVISNNRFLKKIGIDFDFCTYCDNSISITNNSMLDLRDECDGIIKHFTTNREINGNLVDCGCTIRGQFNKYVETLPENCFWLVGNVTIDQTSNYTLLQEKLSNVTRISGGVTISKTNFANFSFFKSLEIIEVDAYKANVLPSITITGNMNLTSMGMKPRRDGLYLTIRNNPNLCVLAQELDALFDGLSLDSNLDIKVCFDNSSLPNVCELSESSSLKDLPEGCTSLVGDLVLTKEFDFANSHKLFDVKVIYGSLTIKNSSLRSTNMLSKLDYIRSIRDEQSPFMVSNNTWLVHVVEFKGIESGAAVLIENNSNYGVWPYSCSTLKTRKTPIVRNNLVDCDSSDTDMKRQFDKYPLNVDVFYGLPKFIDILSGISDNGGTQNQPGRGNDTEEEESSTEGVWVKPEENFINPVTVSLVFFLIQLAIYVE